MIAMQVTWNDFCDMKLNLHITDGGWMHFEIARHTDGKPQRDKIQGSFSEDALVMASLSNF